MVIRYKAWLLVWCYGIVAEFEKPDTFKVAIYDTGFDTL